MPSENKRTLKEIMVDCHKQGMSPLDTAKALFKDVNMQAFGKVVKSVSIVDHVCRTLGTTIDDPASGFSGFSEMLSNQLLSPEVTKVEKLLESATCSMDVIRYVLNRRNLSLSSYLEKMAETREVDAGWFTEHYSGQGILEFQCLEFTRVKHDTRYAEILEKIDRSYQEIEQKDRLHKVLMTG